MRRTLSSAQTVLLKFVFPAIWLPGFAAATVFLFGSGVITRPDGSPPPPEMKWFFLMVTVVGALFIYWSCMRLKRVAIDDRWLYVSNYVQEIQVPLEQVEDISENRWVNIRPITVEFRRPTEFGSRIVFMPKTRWWGFWSAHPVVAELEAAARQARGLPPQQPASEQLRAGRARA